MDIWSDSKQLAKGVREPQSAISSIQTIIKDILGLGRNYDSISILNVGRAKLEKAHILAGRAKISADLGCNFYFVVFLSILLPKKTSKTTHKAKI